MIYRAIQLIQIFLAHERANGRTNEGNPRGPRGPKKLTLPYHLSHGVMQNEEISLQCMRGTYSGMVYPGELKYHDVCREFCLGVILSLCGEVICWGEEVSGVIY